MSVDFKCYTPPQSEHRLRLNRVMFTVIAYNIIVLSLTCRSCFHVLIKAFACTDFPLVTFILPTLRLDAERHKRSRVCNRKRKCCIFLPFYRFSFSSLIVSCFDKLASVLLNICGRQNTHICLQYDDCHTVFEITNDSI